MTFKYPPATLQEYAEYAAAAFAAGHGFEMTLNPEDGTINGLVAIESGSAFARYVAERAERRASTLNI